MYGNEITAGTTGSMLAATGLGIGGTVLTVVGLIFLGVAIIALVRRNSKSRP